MDPAQRHERLRQFEELCRQRGLSLTVQRRAILEAVLKRADHPAADQICDEVKGRVPGVSRTTVYRVLETLVDVGVITKACSPGAATRFDPRTDRHHHLVCRHCEKLIDLNDRQLRYRVEPPDVRGQSFEISGFSIHFHGLCAACRRTPGRKKAAAAEKDKPCVDKPASRKRPARRRKRRTEP